MTGAKASIKILFTCVGRRVELLRSFSDAAVRLGTSLALCGTDASLTAPALRFCHAAFRVPPIASPDYIETLLQICSARQIDLLIPTIDTDLLVLSQNRERFEQIGTKVFIADSDKIALCRDKRKTAEYFHALGLCSPSPVDDYAAYSGDFPAFIKPTDGSSSINAYRADSAEELALFANRQTDYIVQPYIAGEEYTVDIFCDYDGNPVYVTPRKRLAVRAGEVSKTLTVSDETAVAEMKRLIADFKPRGAITVQYIKETATGKNQYLEINPRFGGGAPLSMAAGADSAEATLRLLLGEKLSFCGGAAAENAVYSRFDDRVCIAHGDCEIKAVVFDLDDTLFDEKDYLSSGFAAVAEMLGDPDLQKDFWAAWQNGSKPFDTVLGSLGKNTPEMRASCLETYRNHIPSLVWDEKRLQLLKDLRQKGLKLAVVTDGRPEGQWAKIHALSLREFADEIIVTDDLGGAMFRKPCDIAFRILQRKWGIRFEKMLYVGDNPCKDFDAPRALGMQTLRFLNPNGIYDFSDETGILCDAQTDDFAAFLRGRLLGEDV